MLNISDLFDITAISFFNSNYEIAGIVIYTIILLLIMVLIKDKSVAIIVSLPATIVFMLLGILSTEVAMLMIIISVLAMAFVSRKVLGS